MAQVADVAVDFYQEVATDDHRLEFWMVDVSGNDRPAACDLLPNEIRGYLFWERGTKTLARMLIGQQTCGACFLQFHVFAYRDVFHFRRDNTFACVVHLRHVAAVFSPTRMAHMGKAHAVQG